MMRIRVIPCLQLADERLVKTINFEIRSYIGDPVNTVKIFNDLKVDELCFLDIRASCENRSPQFHLLRKIADECFMPLSYGGGVMNMKTAKEIYSIGFEKIIINTAAVRYPKLISQLSEHYGSQAVIASIDVKKNIFGKHSVYINNATEKIPVNPVEWAQQLEHEGAGEILLTSIDRDGTWNGYDIAITKKIADAVNIPVIANGGAGELMHIRDAISKGHASAIALGSMLIFQQKEMGVLINYPDKELRKILYEQE